MDPIVYLDNAATTALDPRVLEEMMPYMLKHYGNPSSGYSLGRLTRSAVESARKKVAELLGVKTACIYFTSGGTESNNTALHSAVKDHQCTHIITSPTEHHAVLHTVAHLCEAHHLSLTYVKVNSFGEVDLSDLETQLAQRSAEGHRCVVSLMHANNEVGALLPLKQAGETCARYNAIFHSDCVQTIGHYPINLADSGVDFASASGHKFHGPKGTGILYVKEGVKFSPFIHGGGQERRKRAGTENTHGIIGFATALEIALLSHEDEKAYIQSLNAYLRRQLTALSPKISFNSREEGLYTVLSVNFPEGTHTDLMLDMLDRQGICVSGGSACSSGEEAGSHVIAALNRPASGATLRFSFSRLTTVAHIDTALKSIAELLEHHYAGVRS